MAEDLTRFFQETGVRCKWLHSELDAIERIKVLRELREGAFDVLVGINLLREGLDLPEVSLVAILDADKEGFLRSETSLIQTIGRAARNVNAEVILYGDRVTNSMHRAIEETKRRRNLQLQYNLENGITPKSVKSTIPLFIEEEIAAYEFSNKVAGIQTESDVEKHELIEDLQVKMLKAAEELDFEKAAQLRDKIATLKGEKVATPQVKKKRFKKR
jgi:excinuclease ABC subunit B